MWPLQWVIYMDGSSKFLKCCSLAAFPAIAQFITDQAFLTKWNQQLKDRLNRCYHSYEPASLPVLALISVTTAKTQLMCINILLNTVLISLYYYVESSVSISSWYVPYFSYIILQTHTIYDKNISIGFVVFLIVFYFHCTPLHGLVCCTLNYRCYLFPLYLSRFQYNLYCCLP